MFKWIKGLFRKKDTSMARPRELTLEQGTVSLQGFPKEIADALSEHIRSFGKVATNVAPINEQSPSTTNPTTISLTDKAITVRLNPDTKLFEVLTLDIDPTVNVVKKTEHPGRREATMEFKLRAFELHFS